jgi:hypothetical protein
MGTARSRTRQPALRLAAALALACALSACSGGAQDPVLTLEGSYTGTTSSSCQMALRTADGTLVESHAVPPAFHQAFTVKTGKGHYFGEIRCLDGKTANINGFDFEPPRATITLGEIPLN